MNPVQLPPGISPERTTNPVEAEVSNALHYYKLMLVYCHYRNWEHRLFCWLKDPEALENERRLTVQEKVCRETVNQSPEHQEWVRRVAAQQPEAVRRKDNFTGLLDDAQA